MDSGLTEIDLSNFTGRRPEYYSDVFVMEALLQAGDLFELATDLTTLPPDSTLNGRIARRGILAMAEALFAGNAYRDLRASPFKTETIGSYTYTLAEGNVLAGIPTGISWFDVAVSRLASDNGQGVSSVSTSVFDRPGDVALLDGRRILVGPADTELFSQGRKSLESGAQPS